MVLRWQADDGPLILVFGSSLPSSRYILSSPHQLKKEKNVVKVGPPLTKLSGSAHANSGEPVLMPQGIRTSPGKSQVVICFGTNLLREAIRTPFPLELSGSMHACLTVEFNFLHVAGSAIILSRANWCIGWSAPLLFAYIWNGVNKANPDKMLQI